METVLVVGATGNIGVAAVIGALRSKRQVLTIVRNQDSAEKLFTHVGTKEGITTVQADITSDDGVRSVVDQVRAGKLPSFQHVYAAAGGLYGNTKLSDLSTEELRLNMNVNFESNFFAYRATVPYLLEQKNPNSTWTICTGAQGSVGFKAAPAMTQGPLYSMVPAAIRELANTNIRFNEVFLATRVEFDSVAEETGNAKSSDFAQVYEGILKRPEIGGCRVSVFHKDDFNDLKYEKNKGALIQVSGAPTRSLKREWL